MGKDKPHGIELASQKWRRQESITPLFDSLKSIIINNEEENDEYCGIATVREEGESFAVAVRRFKDEKEALEWLKGLGE